MKSTVLSILLATALAAVPSAAGAAFLGAPKSLALPKSSSIVMRSAVPEPLGAYSLCYASPSHCRSRGARGLETADGAVRMDEKLWSVIQSVNLEVNRAIRPRRDGRTDVWQVGGRSGDCEDFALTKRDRLLRKGFPSSALLMATAYTRKGERHAVLVVRTERGDFVLDNLTNAVKPWRSTGLKMESIQSPENPRRWFRI